MSLDPALPSNCRRWVWRWLEPIFPSLDPRGDGRGYDEAFERYMLKPHKIELVEGKLLISKKDRETLLALLLENAGADRAVQLGDPEVWRVAVAKLPR